MHMYQYKKKKKKEEEIQALKCTSFREQLQPTVIWSMNRVDSKE